MTNPSDYPAGVWDLDPLSKPIPEQTETTNRCELWCLGQGMYVGALTHTGVDGSVPKCVTRCAMNRGVPESVAVGEWGLTPLGVPEKPK
jgi:hypothetical protein